MKKTYHADRALGFGSRSKLVKPLQPRVTPLKKPAQSRAKFTVQAIYDAFVRIMRRDGWRGVTTRAVASETGIAIGTLYDYFPNKLALLSGYIRHCIDVMLDQIERDIIQAENLSWRQRLGQLVKLTCDLSPRDLPYFDHAMLMLEHEVAETKHHQRVYDELLAAWIHSFAACTDLPKKMSADMIETAFTAAWGARRYVLLVQPKRLDTKLWLQNIEQICLSMIER